MTIQNNDVLLKRPFMGPFIYFVNKLNGRTL